MGLSLHKPYIYIASIISLSTSILGTWIVWWWYCTSMKTKGQSSNISSEQVQHYWPKLWDSGDDGHWGYQEPNIWRLPSWSPRSTWGYDGWDALQRIWAPCIGCADPFFVGAIDINVKPCKQSGCTQFFGWWTAHLPWLMQSEQLNIQLKISTEPIISSFKVKNINDINIISLYEQKILHLFESHLHPRIRCRLCAAGGRYQWRVGHRQSM